MTIFIRYLFIFIFTNFINLININSLEDNNIKTVIQNINQQESEFIIKIYLNPHEIIYYDSISLSTNSPDVSIAEIEYNISPTERKDELFRNILVFDKNFEIKFKILKTNNNNINNINILLNYLSNTNNYPKEITFSVNPFMQNEKQNITQNLLKPEAKIEINNCPKEESKIKILDKIWGKIQNLSCWTQNLVQTTNSIWIRLLLVFLLGLLMSLTPCIYPMLPITIGILQSQGTKSILNNFFIALAYTIGVSTTFSIFGLIAAFTGHLFGKILVHPIFVILIILVLIYLALSMFGFYDMYIPNLLQTSNNKITKHGSMLSAFLFGLISGSIASPCLSPGLALLLTIVATFANKFLGFILLFIFGIGLSIPLLIIGTFSSSINSLPKSGFWMVEIKKLFGFMLFGMCFYFLGNIVSYKTILWILSIFIFISGFYYLHNINNFDSNFWKKFKNITGVGLIALSVIIFIKSYQETFYPEKDKISDIWITNYDQAIKIGTNSNKNILIDIGAKFCTLCKIIDKKIFNDPEIIGLLNKFVNLKIDATNNSQIYEKLKTKYNIIGVPTILIIDPKNEALIKRWGGEIYDLPKNTIIKELQNI